MILVRRLLGDVLRGRRQRSGRTLRQLAATARVSPGYLSEVERGQKEPSSELLAAICDALEVKLSDVLLELSTELAAAELAAELEAAELGTLVPADGRPASRVPMPARSGDSQTATQTAQRAPMVVGVGAAAPRRAGSLPTAKIPTAVINASPVSSRPGSRSRPATCISRSSTAILRSPGSPSTGTRTRPPSTPPSTAAGSASGRPTSTLSP